MNGRVVLALVFLVGGAGIALAGAQPESSLTPGQAEQAAEGPARVKGVVEEVDREAGTFVLTGDGGEVHVRIDDVPAAIAPGKSLLAEGEIRQPGDATVLEASHVQMGCPSKYGA